MIDCVLGLVPKRLIKRDLWGKSLFQKRSEVKKERRSNVIYCINEERKGGPGSAQV